jgi:hypothetical protein
MSNNLIQQMGEEARQALGVEFAEEAADFNDMIKQTHHNELLEMTQSNVLYLMTREDWVAGLLNITTSTFVTGMMAYRLYLEDVAPEAVARVDAKIRNSIEEPTND